MTEKLEITILGKSLRVIASNENEVNSLQAAARALDQKMHMIRAQNQTLSPEKIAIMAALNTMHELLCLQTDIQQSEQALVRLQALID